MPFHNEGENMMQLQVPEPGKRSRLPIREYIGGMALIENEVGERSIEWIVWDKERGIRITNDYYTE